MNPDELDNLIRDNKELSPHKNYLNTLIKPSVDITFSSGKPKDHESRFGGDPLVSEDFVWPSHKDGEYRFLGQINFSEIQECPKELPSKGLLSLFYAFDENGEIFWGDDGYVLGYYWPIIEELTLSNKIKKVHEAKKIILKRGNEIPRHEDLRNDWPFCTDVLYNIQDSDAFTEDYMLGYPSYYSLAYDPTPSIDWVSLITLTSYDEFEWCWHDADKLMVFIEKSMLKNKNFSNLKTDAG